MQTLPIPLCVIKKHVKAPSVDLSDRVNGRTTNGRAPNQRWPPQQPSPSAATSASAASVAYEEEFVDPLAPVEPMEAVDGGSKATSKAELPYSTLYEMQLEREEQSHQEACDKYGKARVGTVKV